MTFVVQQSFPDPRPTTNPYIVMLRDSLDRLDGVEVHTFTWKRALLGRYDVFHVHWPEILVSGSSPVKALLRQVLTTLLIIRWKVTRTPVIRTQHNLKRPDGISRREHALLGLIERSTTFTISLNPTTEVATGAASAVIAHGHYRDWFAATPHAMSRPGELAFFGLVRRYKGLDRLLTCFREVPGDRSLTIAGRPSSEALADGLREQAADDHRVDLHLEFLSDEELVRTVTTAELIVLPYREMHNSGGVLTALSLNRPVLVPANDVNQLLSDEVGPGWIYQYEGDLSTASLMETLDRIGRDIRADQPDLSRRGWDIAGTAHLDAYRRALRIKGHADQSPRRSLVEEPA